MCGIAGVIHRNGNSKIGEEMSSMLQAMKHRGPDSTGFALYCERDKKDSEQYVMRMKVAESHEAINGYDIHAKMEERIKSVQNRLKELKVKVIEVEKITEYALRYIFTCDGNLRQLANYVEDIEGVEILSIGKGLELVKDLGDATVVSDLYSLKSFNGTHAIGHTRMATESDVDIRSAHPYWAYPFADVSVVHNGQLTNYWSKRRELERKGHRFMSSCDSELIAVYIADKIEQGRNLEDSMVQSVEELDGVFTYLLATSDSLGMAKDTMAAKPMVLFESDQLVALASEEVAIRTIMNNEIDTSDPYDGEVRVWQA